MERRTFNSLMHPNNENWTAQALNMKVNPAHGPDLIDNKKVVEVKFRLMHPGRYTHLCWTVLGYQKDYGKSKEAYWALGTYTLDREISEIKDFTKTTDLEKMVQSREISLVPWEWMNQFQVYHQSGKTKLSKWDHDIIFPKGKLLPKMQSSYGVFGGRVNISEGIDSNIFDEL